MSKKHLPSGRRARGKRGQKKYVTKCGAIVKKPFLVSDTKELTCKTCITSCIANRMLRMNDGITMTIFDDPLFTNQK